MQTELLHESAYIYGVYYYWHTYTAYTTIGIHIRRILLLAYI